MTDFHYKDQALFVEDVPLQNVAAEFGTPCYVYSKKIITQNWHAYYDALKKSGLPYKINYAVKANSNINILKLLAKLDAGFDVVSGGEIDRVIAAGGKASDIVFAGVCKSSAEINHAIDLGIYSFHVESEEELLRINALANHKNKIVNIALRVNPDVTAGSHPYTSTGSRDNKFGIDCSKAVAVYLLAKSLPNINIKGISSHIGSQITTLAPFLNAIEQLLLIIQQLKKHNITLEYIDIGGGLGVCYQDEIPPTPEEYVTAILRKLQDTNLELHIEPGRSIVAKAGILLTKVEYLKQTGNNNFAIIDAAMNDLMRPSLYQSYHAIEPIQLNMHKQAQEFAVVGPICETGDFFALKPTRKLNISSGDLLAVRDCGAYGFSMSSNYNTRPRCAEILVDGNKMQLIRERETIKQLLQNEILDNEHTFSR